LIVLDNTFQNLLEEHIVFGKTIELYDPLSMKFEVQLGKIENDNLVFFSVEILICWLIWLILF